MSTLKAKNQYLNYVLMIVGVIIGIVFFSTAPPNGMTVDGWRVLGLLIPIIMVWATEAVPVGIASMLFLSLVVAFKLASMEIAFKGFASHLPWLMAGAFAIGIAMEQTGLSKRITYFLLSRLNSFWGLVAAVYLTNICLMAVPSSSARSGILAPILKSIINTMGPISKSNFSRWLTYQFCTATDAFVGLMFLTGGAANAIFLGVYTVLSGKTVSWGHWLVVMFVPAVVFAIFGIVGSMIFARPEPELVAKVRNGNVTRQAFEELGRMTNKEWRVLLMFFLSIFLWIVGSAIQLEPGITALVVMSILFLPGVGVLKIDALNKLNWNIVLLIGAVVGVGGILNETGMVSQLSNVLITPVLGPLFHFGLLGVAIGVIVIGFISHLLLPSPNNLSVSLPLLITWGLKTAHLPMAAVLAFLGLLPIITDKIVLFPYQIPPYYVFLAMDVTDRQRYTDLLVKMYPIMVVAAIVGTFIAYQLLILTRYF